MFKSNYFSKKLMILVLCAVLLCSIQACAACTGVYVGSDVSEDESIIYARSNDDSGIRGSYVTVTQAVENEPGRTMPVSMDGSVQTEIPANTYQYTATPYMNSTLANFDQTVREAAGSTNEYGVAISMSVSAYPNNASLQADPYVKTGICEDAGTDIVICQSKTAREGVDVLLGIVDKYGSSESNIVVIMDQNEAWYIEMYTGHQYAAVKLPSDKVCVFGNEFTLEYLSDFEEYVTSKDLISLAQNYGFAVYGKNNEINLFETYSGMNITADYNHLRTWFGHQYLAPSKFGDDYDHDAMYPLCFEPDEKVSVHDVCQILRSRYEGTDYSPDENNFFDVLPIGTESALNAHVIQVFPNLPSEMSCVTWFSGGPTICGVFVPLSNDCINVSKVYAANQPANESNVFDVDNYPYYTFKEITTRSTGPENFFIYAKPIQEYWYEAESNMISGMSEVLKQAAEIGDEKTRAEYITSYCNDMQTKAFNDGKEILKNLIWTQNTNYNIYQLNKSSGQKNILPPMEIKLNASKYEVVPDVPGPENTTNSSIKSSDLIKVFKNATQFSATFFDSERNYLTKGSVITFNLNGMYYNRTVGESGLAKLNINLNPGNYIVTSINTFTGERVSNNVTVISRIIENRDITKYYKNATQYTVKLIGDDGSPVGAGETVTFNINGVFYNRTTNESGIAKLNINLHPDDYIITAEYKDCRVSNNIKVLSVLSAGDLTKKYGVADQFIATLVDGEGKVLAGETVQFNVNGVFYNRVTDSNGQAKLNINLQSGEYIITSSYNGVNIANTITISA